MRWSTCGVKVESGNLTVRVQKHRIGNPGGVLSTTHAGSLPGLAGTEPEKSGVVNFIDVIIVASTDT